MLRIGAGENYACLRVIRSVRDGVFHERDIVIPETDFVKRGNGERRAKFQGAAVQKAFERKAVGQKKNSLVPENVGSRSICSSDGHEGVTRSRRDESFRIDGYVSMVR